MIIVKCDTCIYKDGCKTYEAIFEMTKTINELFKELNKDER
jgi:hypothetical protein